jgi:hypothetical protein
VLMTANGHRPMGNKGDREPDETPLDSLLTLALSRSLSLSLVLPSSHVEEGKKCLAASVSDSGTPLLGSLDFTFWGSSWECDALPTASMRGGSAGSCLLLPRDTRTKYIYIYIYSERERVRAREFRGGR